MEALRSQRAFLRLAVKKAYDAFVGAYNNPDCVSGEIRLTYKALTGKTKRLFQLDRDVAKAVELLEDIASIDFGAEQEEIEKYHDFLTDAEVKYEDFLYFASRYDERPDDRPDDHRSGQPEEGSRPPSSHHGSTRSNQNASNQSAKQNTTKLPKHNLPTFNGDIRKWLNFWSQFKKVHENEDLSLDDKFSYLIGCMEKDTPAKEVVDTFPASGEYYENAINYLREIFGSESLLIEVHVRDLLKLLIEKVLNRQSDQCSLQTLLLKLETQLRALTMLGMTEGKNAAFLYPLVEATLPDKILADWGSSADNPSNSELFQKTGQLLKGGASNNKPESNNSYENLEILMRFLKVKARGENRVLHTQAFTDFSGLQGLPPRINRAPGRSSTNQPTAASLIATGRSTNNSNSTDSSSNAPRAPLPCVFCEKAGHNSQDCNKAAKLPYEEREKLVYKDGRCIKCLKGRHKKPKCRTDVCCPICQGPHFAILCRKFNSPPSQSASASDPASKSTARTTDEIESTTRKDKLKHFKKTNTTVARSASHYASREILMQTLKVRILTESGMITFRALCDSGSQRSYIKDDVAKRIGLKPQRTELLRHSVFGAKEMDITHPVFQVSLQSLTNDYKSNFTLLGQEVICGAVGCLRDSEYAERLQSLGITLSDYGDEEPGEIHILLGADAMAKILTGLQHEIDEGLLAVHTKLGWTLIGECDSTANNLSPTNICISSISDLWDLERLNIRDPFEIESEEHRQAAILQSFRKNIKFIDDKRYQVPMLWKEIRPILNSNVEIASQRLLSTTRKLLRENRYDAYNEILKEWEASGIIEAVDESQEPPGPTHYIPHRGVVRESSETTKLRPVFDASCKDKNRNSLNASLESGPNLIHQMPTILTRFRQGKIAATADIKKADLQIALQEEDRDMLRFLWWEDLDKRKTKTYRHCRVVFGVACSSFLLAATLDHHLDAYEDDYEETVQQFRDSLYVDDTVTSMESVEAFEKFKKESEDILDDGGFELSKWRTNAYPDDAQNPITTVLGLKWDIKNDTLFCATNALNIIPTPTKRSLLSVAHSIFDPLGFTCPATLLPRILLQETWQTDLKWDDPLPADIQQQFRNWINQIHFLENCQIPRYFGASFTHENASLHVFCDASKDAYAAVVFIRIVSKSGVIVQLVEAKNRVAPIKKDKKNISDEGVQTNDHKSISKKEIVWIRPTIPRLELLAATIGIRLLYNVQEALRVHELPVTYWSDSKTVLCWIKQDSQQCSVFVRNRVEEIRKFSTKDQWRFVPGDQNPADLPSRGCSAKRLAKEKWWEGPEWLKEDPIHWPHNDLDYSSVRDELQAEMVKTTHTNVANAINHRITGILDNKCSNYLGILRKRAWINRYIDNLRAPRQQIKANELSLEEIRQAKILRKNALMIRYNDVLRNPNQPRNKPHELSLAEIRKAEIDILKTVQAILTEKQLKKFRTSIDEDGLIRIIPRVRNPGNINETANLILLPPCTLVEKFLTHKHWDFKHAGVPTMLSLLREKFWIIRARQQTKRIVNACRACKFFNSRHAKAPEAPLPLERTELGQVFKNTGVDLAGPMELIDGSQVWVVIFTCAVFRAVHLDIVTSASADCFMLALRRFISRRGRVTTMISDNGGNFTATADLLKLIKPEEITDPVINWIFNPPTASWWGGFWERLIRSMKDLLKRNLGRKSLDYEEFITVLCECENIMNSRPLTYITEDDNEFAPLTPAHFIRDIIHGGTSDLDLVDAKRLQNRANYLNNLRADLRARFRHEYLALLIHNGPQTASTDIRRGDIVLIESKDKKRLKWQLGRVLKVFTGRDGHSRSAEVRTSTAVIQRPFQRLYPLEIRTKVSEPLPEIVADESDDDTQVSQIDQDESSYDSDVEEEESVQSVSDVEENESDQSVSESEPKTPDRPVVYERTRKGREVRPPKRLDLFINSKFLSQNDFFI